MKKDLTSKADVATIVNDFYDRIRKEETLGPIFNRVITDWETHLETLVSFWEMNLFGGKGYSGNPIKVHQHVDSVTGNTIEAFHFGIWLNLWFATIDTHFAGENANNLKRRARKMQTPIMIAIYEGRASKPDL